ncbi:MAG: acyltransferase family protein [Agathobacter sp.]|nr:acyltransferase family protein [Agathobacter sp.]
MRQKNYNIEIMRIIAFVMVIVIHVSNYFCRAYGSVTMGEYLFSLVINSLARVSVPCFFMMSGSLLLGRTEGMDKALARAKKFLGVLCVWTVLYVLFNIFYTKQGCDWKLLLEKPAEAHLWYLYVMIPIYIVLPFLQILCKEMGEALEKAFVIIGFIWLLIVHLMPYFKLDLYFDLPVYGDRSYIFYLFCGYLISKYKEKIQVKQSHLLLLFLGGGMINVVLTAVATVMKAKHFERIFEYGSPFVIISSLAFFAYIMRLGDGNISLSNTAKKWIDICCSCSFGIYLIHIMFLDNYKIHVAADAVSVYWVLPLLVMVILVISFVVVYVLRKTKIGKMIL